MKKVKMDAAKLQLNKNRVTSLGIKQAGQVAGGDVIRTITYCKPCFEYTYAPPTGVCRPLVSGNCPPPGEG